MLHLTCPMILNSELIHNKWSSDRSKSIHLCRSEPKKKIYRICSIVIIIDHLWPIGRLFAIDLSHLCLILWSSSLLTVRLRLCVCNCHLEKNEWGRIVKELSDLAQIQHSMQSNDKDLIKKIRKKIKNEKDWMCVIKGNCNVPSLSSASSDEYHGSNRLGEKA